MRDEQQFQKMAFQSDGTVKNQELQSILWGIRKKISVWFLGRVVLGEV